MTQNGNFQGIYQSHQDKLYQNKEEWIRLLQTGHAGLVPLRESMLKIGEPNTPRCVLCYVPSEGYDGEVRALRESSGLNDLDEAYAKLYTTMMQLKEDACISRRSKRNELFCNCCDAYIEAFPGGADVELPILITDLREGATIGLELRRQVSNIATHSRGYMLQDRGDGFMHSFPYGFAPQEIENKKKWALTKAIHSAIYLAKKTWVPSPTGSPLRLGIGLNHGMTYVGAPDEETLPNRIDMILVLGSATATISARLCDYALEGSAVIALDTVEQSDMDIEAQGWKVVALSDSIVPALRVTP